MPLRPVQSSYSINNFVDENIHNPRAIINSVQFHLNQKNQRQRQNILRQRQNISKQKQKQRQRQSNEKKPKVKKRFYLTNHRLFNNNYNTNNNYNSNNNNISNNNNDYQRSSNYSSSSKYTSFDKNRENLFESSYGRNKNNNKNIRSKQKSNTKNSSPQKHNRNTSYKTLQKQQQQYVFKQSQSAYYNRIKQKYLQRDADSTKIKHQMLLSLQRKTNQLQALRIHRDQLKFISNNNPYTNNIKIGYMTLKQKAKIQQQLNTIIYELNKDISNIQTQSNVMNEYYDFLINSLYVQKDEDLIIDTLQQQRIMIQNLQIQTNHLFRELKQQDKKTLNRSNRCNYKFSHYEYLSNKNKIKSET